MLHSLLNCSHIVVSVAPNIFMRRVHSFMCVQVLRDPYDDSDQFAIVSVPSGVERWKSLAFNKNDEYVHYFLRK